MAQKPSAGRGEGWQGRRITAKTRYSSAPGTEERAVEEFNRGFDDYKRGVSYEDEPHGITEDQWRVGWARAAFEPMRTALRRVIARAEGAWVMENDEDQERAARALEHAVGLAKEALGGWEDRMSGCMGPKRKNEEGEK
jgi:hypothetical protein